MSGQILFSSFGAGRSLQLIKDSMLQSDELPLAEVLDDRRWGEVFANHEIDFGAADDAVYTPAIQAAAVAGRTPRTLSFTTTMQTLAVVWTVAAIVQSEELVELGTRATASERVGNRPDRVEPRANKRRPKLIAFLTKPRNQARISWILSLDDLTPYLTTGSASCQVQLIELRVSGGRRSTRFQEPI